jgi:L-ascorbate 6-phosphate lactonase
MSLMSLMQEIRDFPVSRNTVAIWWLGQNGFIFKTAEGTLLSTDLYLTNSCHETYPIPASTWTARCPSCCRPKS